MLIKTGGVLFDNLCSSTRGFERILLHDPDTLDQSDMNAAESAAIVAYCPDFLSPSRQQSIMTELLDLDSWQQEELMMYGRPVRVPRRVSYHGDAGAAYNYSGLNHQPNPWSRLAHRLCHDINELTGLQFNSVLINHYRNGEDYMGWHSDSERELGPEPVIASVSLGCERRFRFRSKANRRHVLDMWLDPGSLLLMSPAVQKNWQHMLPRARGLKTERINMTFRHVVTV